MNNMTFTLKEDREYDYRIDFVFMPEYSHCHSFNDNPPTNWEEVYKVYYSWKIVEIFEDDTEVLFNMSMDECSCLTELSYYIRDILSDKNEYCKVNSFGQPGSRWFIQADDNIILFEIWKDPSNQGYRFYLTRDKAEEFAKYLDEVNQYMLEHGESI